MTTDNVNTGLGGTILADIEEVPVHVYTRTRIVALLVIGVLVLGLAYLRFGTGDSSVSVPDGAQAGDLILEPCTYGTEDGSYDADCGTLRLGVLPSCVLRIVFHGRT